MNDGFGMRPLASGSPMPTNGAGKLLAVPHGFHVMGVMT